MGLLEWFGEDFDVFEGVVFAFVGEAFVFPGLDDDVDVFAEECVAVLGRDAECVEFGFVEAASGAPVDASSGEDVEQGDFFGEAKGVIEGGE